MHYGWVHRDGVRIDEVLVAVFRTPRSFTREDVVEISCHGGLLAAKRVLECVLAAGARLAEPGEFTKRAFLNGRIDLAQAEAVADLIHARTDLALRAANEQLEGKLSERIHALRDDLMKILAHVEAHIDFPDEDIAPDTQSQLLARLQKASDWMEVLLTSANEGQILRRGVRAAILGEPNAGKSSLLNQLLGRERAIVSPIPGTTRDTIEETAVIRGLPIVFIDTAGLREAGDEIEQEGIRRSLKTAQEAELILHVIDSSQFDVNAKSVSVWDQSFPVGKKRIRVWNKVDQIANADRPSLGGLEVQVSCKTGEGIESLKDALKSALWSGDIHAEMLQVMMNSRHQEALRRAREATLAAAGGLASGQTLEVVAMELRIATQAVGEIVGKTTTEDLLDSIFSQFCIGK